MADIRSVQ